MVIALAGLLGLSLQAVVAAQGEPGSPAEPATATVEVTVWRRVSNPSLLYVSTRPEGGSWRTLNTALDMSRRSDSGLFHQSNAVSVHVPLGGTSGANVEVTVWRRISNPSLLYLSTRPEGGSWQTQDRALDMSRRSGSGLFHQSSAVLVEVPLLDTPDAGTCVSTEQIKRVFAATFQVQTSDGSGTAFYIGDGEWITNHHVVEAVASADLVNGETRISASVAGSLPDFDLALLRAQPTASVPALRFVGSRPPELSEVSVVGFPYGVRDTPSVTGGVVSKHGPLSQFSGFPSGGMFVQVDANSNPGNSGGPIVDDCGAVVGVVFGGIEETPSGRDVDGVEFGIAAETVAAQLANLRSSVHNPGDTPQGDSSLTISAFCTYWSSEDLDAEECDRRASNLDTVYDRWNVWAQGVVDFDNVLYRFDGGASLLQAGVWDALLAAGCHELEVAEDGISTHWSAPYEFCFVSSTPTPTPTPTSSIPAIPTGLWVAKVDIPFAPDDIDVSWNVVPGATWYELYHAAGDGEWTFKATVTNTTYVDTFPSLLFADHYTVNACNSAGCSAFSAVATQY